MAASSADLKRELQRALVRLILTVVAVDAVAIAAYYLLGLEERDRTARLLFTIVWVAATLAAVLPNVRRMRELRTASRRSRGS